MIIQMKTKHNSKWPYIPDHPYGILIIGGSGSGKTNALLNLTNNKPNIDKIYLYAKYQYLINKHEKAGLKHFINIQTIFKMFIKILMNTIQVKTIKYLEFLMI